MTALATYEPSTNGVAQSAPATDPTGGRLVAWAAAAQAANQLARSLVQTTFVPATFKGNMGDATAAIIMGDELGLSPLAALRSIYAVHGTPAMYARTMVALALAHGHQVWTEKSTPSEVVVCGQRRGSEHIERSAWTIARAQKAGYTSNKKYQSSPEEMLYAKASAEIARKIAADVLIGLPYSVEDLELDQPAPTTTVSRAAAKTTAKRAAAPAAPEPEFDKPPTDVTGLDEVAPADAAEPITKAQLSKLHVSLGENGLDDRDAGLAYISGVVGRDVASSKELSKDECSRVIDALETVGASEYVPDDDESWPATAQPGGTS